MIVNLALYKYLWPGKVSHYKRSYRGGIQHIFSPLGIFFRSLILLCWMRFFQWYLARKENNVIWYMWRKGMTVWHILLEMLEMFGHICPSKATIYRWFQLFENGDEHGRRKRSRLGGTPIILLQPVND